MRSRIVSQLQIFGCTILLSWTTIACAQEETPEAGPPPNDPLVVKPKTIEEKFDAVLFMLKLARPEMARYYLEQTLADNPTDEDLLKLRDQHGTGTFLQLTGLPELNPPATELLKRLNNAVQRHVTDPGYADGLIQKLEGSPRERMEALSELRHLGPYAIPPMMQSLVQNKNANRETLALTMQRLGTEAVPPLIGALSSPNPDVRAVAARVLGHIGSSTDAIWLWAPAFTADEPTGSQTAARESLARLIYGDPQKVGRITSDGAARKLLAAATDYLSGKHKWQELFDESLTIPVWTWDANSGTVVEHPVPRPEAAIFFAERLAREASLLAPDMQQGPIILLASLFARDVEQNQWQFPLSIQAGGALDLAVRTGPDTCEAVLRYALDQKLTAAALGSLQALRFNGSPNRLRGGALRCPVISALNDPEIRVQFAAAITILHWEPTFDFSGSRRVVEILARTLSGNTNPGSVVIDPNIPRANATAGLFTEVGFNASLAQTGMEGFRIAADQGDIELAVLHPNVIRWELSQTIANFRADARTASIPLVIYGPAEIHDQFEHFTRDFERVVYVNEANEPLEINRDLSPILAQLSPPQLTAKQRRQHIQVAAFWLRRIAISHATEVFNLVPAEEALSKAIYVPERAEDALIALGAIGRASVQETLFQLATAPAVQVETRQLAASQLAFHIQRFGPLLKPENLALLKTSFDAEQDMNLRTAFGSVIGSLKPSPAAARIEILDEPASSAPVEVLPAQQQ